MQNQKQSKLIIIKAKTSKKKNITTNYISKIPISIKFCKSSHSIWVMIIERVGEHDSMYILYAFYFHCHAWMSTKSKSKHCVHNFLTLPKAHCNLKPEINTIRHSHVFNGFIIYEKCQSLRWFFDSKSEPRPVFCFSF